MSDPALDQSTDDHRGPKCPHCGEVSKADDPWYYTDDRIKHTCGWCEKDFEFTYHRTDIWRAFPTNSEGE